MHWSLEVSTAPASEPITTALAKVHLRETLSDATNDTYIDSLVTVARKYVEQVCSIAMITQTCKLYLDRFPVSSAAICLPRSPAIAISSITYVDTDGATQTWSSAEYALDVKSRPSRLYLAYNSTYPSTRPISNAVTITYTAGYGASASSVPADLIHAMKLLITHWYENRESSTPGSLTDIPFGVKALLNEYRLRYDGPIDV